MGYDPHAPQLSTSSFMVRAVLLVAFVGGLSVFAMRRCTHDDTVQPIESRHDYLSVTVREGRRSEEQAKQIDRARREDLREVDKFDAPSTPREP
jgi:hypothetical protein